ncbi:MAG: ABC transporter permease [Chitinophagaceae bacterium]
MNKLFFIAQKIYTSEKNFSKLILLIASWSLALSVATLIIIFALVNGFRNTISEKMYSMWGNIRVQLTQNNLFPFGEYSGILRNDKVEQVLKQDENILFFSPFITQYGIVQSKTSMEGLLLKGLQDLKMFNKFIIKGNSLNKDSSYKQILISKKTAQRLEVDVGDKVLLHIFKTDEEKPRTRLVIVQGIYNTDVDEYDKQIAICDISFFKHIGIETIGGYEVYIPKNRVEDIEIINMNLLDKLPLYWSSFTLNKTLSFIFEWLNFQRVTEHIALAIFGLLIIINIIAVFLVFVIERGTMIGILFSFGATKFTIQKIIIFSGMPWIVKGIFSGVLLGLGFVFLQDYFGFITLNQSDYMIAKAEVLVNISETILLVFGIFIICILSLFIPALFVGTFSPMKILRFK